MSTKMINDSDDEEEPDYMSEDFLNQCAANDMRPGLIHSRTDKRKFDMLKEQQRKNQTKQDLERNRLKSVEEALKVPISQENKGYKMLAKMGYKPGTSIGKPTVDATTHGIKEPIAVDFKKGRGGLGKEQHELETMIKKAGVQTQTQEEYRMRYQSSIKAREVANDLRKAQFACQSLDQADENTNSNPIPIATWYWPCNKTKKPKIDEKNEGSGEDEDEAKAIENYHEKTKRFKSNVDPNDSESSETDDDDEEEDNVADEVKLSEIMNYLRTTYFYCIWCGNKFDGEKDMIDSCPGLSRDDH